MEPIRCIGGLELITPKTVASPGTLSDCLNYEVAIAEGYRRIDGISRYDGRPDPNVSEAWFFQRTITSSFTFGEVIRIQGGDDLGIYVGQGDQIEIEGEFQLQNIFIVASSKPVLGNDAGSITIEGATSGITAIVPMNKQVFFGALPSVQEAITDGQAYLDIIKEQEARYQGIVTSLGLNGVIGLHHFKNNLYAVAEPVVLSLNVGPEENNPTETLSGQYRPGDVLAIGDVTDSAPFGHITVTDVLTASGDWADGDATILVEGEQLQVVPALTGLTSVTSIGFIRMSEASPDIFPGGTAQGLVGAYLLLIGSTENTLVTVLSAAQTGILTTGNVTLDLQVLRQNSGPAIQDTTGGVVTSNAAEDFIDTLGQHVPADAKDSITSTWGSITSESFEREAVLYKATETGWKPVEMGWEVGFDQGNVDQVNTIYDNATTDASEIEGTDTGNLNGQTVTSTGANSWVADDGTMPEALLDGDTNFVSSNIGGSTTAKSAFLDITDLLISIPDLDSITGVEVTVRTKTDNVPLNDDAYFQDVRLIVGENQFSANKADTTNQLSQTYSNDVFGGNGDNWGAQLTPGVVKSSNFGVRLRFGKPTTNAHKAYVSEVKVKVFHRQATTKVYFRRSATDQATADVLYFHKAGGSVANNDVRGTLSIRNLDGTVEPGQVVYTEPGGAGTALFTTNTVAARNRLPGLKLLDENKSRYQMISANYFAVDGLEAVYGCNGAGRAFTFNDNYFFFIRTGMDEGLDKPRHIAAHQATLVLSYQSGEIAVSVASNPASFDGVDNAISAGVGDRVTGMIPLEGQALGIFTEQKILALQGTISANFVLTTISPTSGAIEYTVKDMGFPVFADFRGIGTVATTDRYGDFSRGRLSDAIRPFLLPRLQGIKLTDTLLRRPVDAEVVRNKNQYLLFFADGVVLSMTMRGQDTPPEFMIRKYVLDNDYDNPIIPRALASGVTEDGTDRVFMAPELNPLMTATRFVFEIDRGVTFDGTPIDGVLVFNPNHSGDPGQYARYNVLHLYGIKDNYGSVLINTGNNYTTPPKGTQSVELGSLTDAYSPTEQPFYEKVRVNERGRDVTLRIDTDGTLSEPAHAIQTFTWFDESPRRRDR